MWSEKLREKNVCIVFMRERRLTTKFTYIENFMNVNSTENKALWRRAWFRHAMLSKKLLKALAESSHHSRISHTSPCMTCQRSMFLHKKNFNEKLRARFFSLPRSRVCVCMCGCKCGCKWVFVKCFLSNMKMKYCEARKTPRPRQH